MNEKTVSRRIWIRNFIIIFLIVMLLLTFFSNTILNYSLPEVAVQYPSSGTISSKINGNGTIYANQNYQVTLDETRVINTVNVRRGDTILRGDVLFTLEDTESQELTDARSALIDMEFELIRKKNERLDEDTSALEKAITEKEEALKKAQNALLTYEKADALYEEAVAGVALVKDEIADITAKLTAISRETEKNTNLMNETIAGYQIEYSLLYQEKAAIEALLKTAKTKRTEKQKDLNSAKAAYNTADASLKELLAKKETLQKSYDSLSATIEGYKTILGGTSIYSLQYDLAMLEEERLACKIFLAAVSDYSSALNTYKSTTAAAVVSAKANLEEKQAAYERYTGGEHYNDSYYQLLIDIKNEELLNAYGSYSYPSYDYTTYASVRKLYEDAKTNAKTAQDAIEATTEQITVLQTSMTTLSTTVAEKETAFNTSDNAVKRYEAIISYMGYQDTIAALKSETDTVTLSKTAAEEKLAKAVEKETEAKAITQMTKAEVEDKVTAAEKELSNAKADLTYKVNEIALQKSRYDYDIKVAEKNIENQKATILLLESKTISATVTSPLSGRVESINVIAGEKVSAGNVLAELVISEKGYTMTANLTNEQAAKVRVGDVATVSNYWWGSVPTLTVVSIKTDPSSQGKTKTVTFNVTGDDLSNGQNISFALGSRSNSYNRIVPNTAIREDNKGKFVLIVSSKSTPLGNRYTATRVDVTVLASDETQTAVSGTFDGWEYVITTSSQPISDGMQIRLSNN